MRAKILILIPMFVICAFTVAFAGGSKVDTDVVYKYQFGVDVSVPLAKDLWLDIEPEMWLREGFDKFLLNGGVTYRTFGVVYWSAIYRFIVCDESAGESSNEFGDGSPNYASRFFNRYAFEVTYKDRFGRFTPSFRFRYNNYDDDEEIVNEKYLRYRAKLAYDICDCQLAPFVSVEAYQEIEDNFLYKMRYMAGVNYRMSEKSTILLGYKFDHFIMKSPNSNTFNFGYKYMF